VERAGTTYFPTDKGQKLYGELVMEVWLNRQGKVVNTIVLHSSGNALLDKRARAIVMQAGPLAWSRTRSQRGQRPAADFLALSLHARCRHGSHHHPVAPEAPLDPWSRHDASSP
jgi:TonB family protein